MFQDIISAIGIEGWIPLIKIYIITILRDQSVDSEPQPI
jgi:hypothetical protein